MPLDFPYEFQDTILGLSADVYRDHRAESRTKGQVATTPLTLPKSPEFDSTSSEKLSAVPPKEPTIDLVARRLEVKWEPMFNIVHRYAYCRCIVRMTSPASCEKEKTLLIVAECPRHNCKGHSFLDYGNQDYRNDPYFDDFGGYDIFRFLVLSHPSGEVCRVVSQVLGGDKFLTEDEKATISDAWLGLSDAERARYSNRLVEYWTEVHEEFDSLGVELPVDAKERLRERRERREQLNAKYGFPVSYGKLKAPELPWTKELEEILERKWSGKFHWIVEGEN